MGKRERKKREYHSLVYSLDSCKSQGWARLKPVAKSFTLVSSVCDRDPKTWTTFCCVSQAVGMEELD